MAAFMQAAATGMAEVAEAKKTSHLPSTPSEVVRDRWRELLGLSYATRRVTRQEIEPGVHAVVVPPSCREERKGRILEADLQSALRQVPEMARGVRLTLDKIHEYELRLECDFRRWMGAYGQDLASGKAGAVAFIDLAYFEAALLDRLWNRDVQVEFNTPLSFFRRGLLMDYANVLEAVTAMVFEGRSLADTADALAREVLDHLELYASNFLRLSSLYKECRWRIEGERFVMEIQRISLAFQYWELRGGEHKAGRAFTDWTGRIENLLREALPSEGRDVPKSFAA